MSVTAFRLHEWARAAPGGCLLGLGLACAFPACDLGQSRASLLPPLKGQKGCVRLGSQVKSGVSSWVLVRACGLAGCHLGKGQQWGPVGSQCGRSWHQRRAASPESLGSVPAPELPALPGRCRQKVAWETQTVGSDSAAALGSGENILFKKRSAARPGSGQRARGAPPVPEEDGRPVFLSLTMRWGLFIGGNVEKNKNI